MSEIVTVARSAANAIRSHRFPVLEVGNISFPSGRYVLEFEPGTDRASFILRHYLDGAPMITDLLARDKARYVCIVSSPMSSYRETHISGSSRQDILWNEDDLGEPPLFTPMVVSVESLELKLNVEDDGVHNIWNGRTVVIEKGSRLAVGHVVQLRSSILQLLHLQANDDLKEGEFYVDAETEEGFRFQVNLNPKLHAFLQFAGRGGIRDSIMTHIVTACFALLQRDFNEDDENDGGWHSHQNLRALSDFLESKGLPHWCDDEFRPEWVATTLYPHCLPDESEHGEDE